MADRINKFYVDLENLLLAKKIDKYVKEVNKLRVWMQKHQDESIPTSYKARLVEILGKVRGVLTKSDTTSMVALLEMYCALPEGKLTTTKGKSLAVKWIESDGLPIDDKISPMSMERQNIYRVIDASIEGGDDSPVLFTLESVHDSSICLEQIIASHDELGRSILDKFNSYISDDNAGDIGVERHVNQQPCVCVVQSQIVEYIDM